MTTKNLWFGLLASVLLISCDDSGNDAPLGAYEHGILIVNEGNGTAGSVSFIGDDLTTVRQNIYADENAGDGLGGYLQSMFFYGDEAYIISNGSNKITVVNRYTFKLIDKIETGFSVPRYGVVMDGKAYVTNLGSFTNLTDDFVTVIDLTTHAVTGSYPVNAIAERLVAADGKLYIANGSYGDGHSVTVMNPQNGAILSQIETGLAPVALAVQDNSVYALCSNYTDASKIVRIDLGQNTVAGTIPFASNLINAQNLDIEGGKFYFTVNSDVYTAPLNAATVSGEPLFTSAATTLYGFTVENGKIYASDARDYASDGKVFIYDLDGTQQNQFTVGLIPNSFYFN